MIEIEDELAIGEEACPGDVHRLGRDFGSRPLPARCERKTAILARRQQQPGGAVGHVGHGLDHPLTQRHCPRVAVAHGPGETQPFLAIVVAVLEQIFGHGDLEPAAQALRWQERQRPALATTRNATCSSPAESPPARAMPRNATTISAEIAGDDEQRERLEGEGARRAERLLGRALQGADRQQQRHGQRYQRAQAGERGRAGSCSRKARV